MIKFAKTLTESYLPIEPVDIDGITFWQAHFATCPQAGKFRKKIKRSEKTN
ncbi:hypothetical protein L6251_01705 [Candidatus Parcubacteria bacterium]|nr:hypothetical protein [Patescibacteria group bacterium]MBU4477453.1 hypothetical protein [Patescibacteria group bacterium]MCG2699116.1 hypothetical protein [Candidatus Parcubacteria bacterium]